MTNKGEWRDGLVQQRDGARATREADRTEHDPEPGVDPTTGQRDLEIRVRLRRMSNAYNALYAQVQGTLKAMDSLTVDINSVYEELSRLEARVGRSEAPEAMSIAAVARYLGVGRSTVYELIEGNRLPAKQAPNGRTIVRKQHVDHYLDTLPPKHRHRRKIPPAA